MVLSAYWFAHIISHLLFVWSYRASDYDGQKKKNR